MQLDLSNDVVFSTESIQSLCCHTIPNFLTIFFSEQKRRAGAPPGLHRPLFAIARVGGAERAKDAELTARVQQAEGEALRREA